MSGKTIGTTMNYGFAGNYARQPDMIIGSFEVSKDSSPVKFGEPVFLNADGTVSTFREGGTEETFVGVASSEIKTTFDYNSMEGVYLPGQLASVMQRGAISVLCNVGTPAVGGKVYVRTEENSAAAGSVLGGFESEPDDPNTVQIKNCVWRTGKDNNNVAELLLRTINYV